MGHYVYKFVSNGEIIYFGKSKSDANLLARINCHIRERRFQTYLDSCEIYYTELLNKDMSEIVESELIRRYWPILNRAKKSNWDGLAFPELKWNKFIQEEFVQTHELKKRSSSKQNYTAQAKKEDREKKTARLMSQYYCEELLKNVANEKEDGLYYTIKVPLHPDDTEGEYCTPPHIQYDNEKFRSQSDGYLNLGICSIEAGNVVFKFDKRLVFLEWGDIPVGLEPRIANMKKAYEYEYRKLCYRKRKS